MYIQNRTTKLQSSTNNSNSVIIKEMSNDQIKTGKVSKKNHYAYYVSGTQTDVLRTEMNNLVNQTPRYIGHELQSELKQPISLDANHPYLTINELLKDDTFILHGSKYQYNAQLSSANSLVYNQKAFGSQLIDPEGQIRFTLNDANELVSYTQEYLEDIKPLREKNETISEERALIWLYQYNEIPNNSKVMWTRLGYTRLLSIEDSRVFIPTWVIGLKQQNSTQIQIKKINAYSGVIIKETN